MTFHSTGSGSENRIPTLFKVASNRWSEEAAGLMARAPVDLRVNTAKTTVEAARAELKATGLTPEPTPWSRGA